MRTYSFQLAITTPRKFLISHGVASYMKIYRYGKHKVFRG